MRHAQSNIDIMRRNQGFLTAFLTGDARRDAAALIAALVLPVAAGLV